MGLPRGAMEELVRHYEGRVLAFDQFTLSSSPSQNAEFFLRQATQGLAGARAEFDILCHSRGGIVARSMVEMGKTLVPEHDCEFDKVFMVAVPNQGSVLANPEHTVEMLDMFTNLLTNFPDGPTIYAVEILLAIVKLLAYTAEKYVPGIAALGTEGFIKTTLNKQGKSPHAGYAAAAANYDPDPSCDNAFLAAACNAVVDRIFTIDGAAQKNDLVVPCDGVFAANGHPSFPIDDLFSQVKHITPASLSTLKLPKAHCNR